DRSTAQALIDALRAAGVLPVALAYGTSDNDALAQQLGLPLLAKFRAQYERADAGPVAPAPAPARAGAAAPPAAAPPPPRAAGEPGLVQTAPVRSGQQVYAENRDLT